MKKFTSVFLICVLIFSSMLSISASANTGKVYYLFGYINGANYACEEDYRNMGEYRFTNGKLTARFDKVSYVAVKEADNANWYMTDGWMGDVHSVQLLNTEITGENSNKLKVPEGVDVEFTLTENGDGSLTLSYTAENEGYPIRAQLWDYVNIEVAQIINGAGNYWTEETEMPFLQALKEANDVLDNKNATDKELVNAYDNLVTAVNNLKKQDKEYWTQKLISLTVEYSCDFEDIEYMYTIYTKESFDNFFEAYKNADKAIGSEELSLYDLSQLYYNLADSRKNLVRLSGQDNPDTDKPYYKSDEFKTLLKVYCMEIGGGYSIDYDFDECEGTIDGKNVIYYHGLRIFKSVNGINVFGLSDMLCTVGEEVIDGYKFYNPVFFGTEKNLTGLCVYCNGKITSIKDAVSSGLVTAEQLAEVIPHTEKGGTIPTVSSVPTKPSSAPVTLPTEADRPTMPVLIPDNTGNYAVDIDDKNNLPDEIASVEPTEPMTVINPIEPAETQAVTDEYSETFVTEPQSVTEPVQSTYVQSTDIQPSTDPSQPDEQIVIVPQPTVPEPTLPVVKPVNKKNNTIKVSVKTKTIKAKKLKKKAQTLKALTVKNAQGKVSYKLVKNGITKKIRKYVKINSKGVITISKWKKAKKGIYKIEVAVKAAGNVNYNSKAVVKTVKLKIK